jgi:hypothetical protein
MNENEKQILTLVSKEIEERFKCKVISINLTGILGTPNVYCKIIYNDDFIYKPCEHFTPETIVFSERSVTFFRRLDYFNSAKKIANLN